jgi:uncharacterized SAM-binding protein YcdF (DUF218 family)
VAILAITLRVMVRFLTAIGLLCLFVIFSPFVGWYATRLQGTSSVCTGEVLVVLSASGPNVGIMDPSTYWRCFMAVLCYRQHPFRKIVVTGRESAPGMRDFFVFNGIPPERILVEDNATSTRENALLTSRMLGDAQGRIVLLTSDSHMLRAHRTFLKAGLIVSPCPVPDVIKRSGEFSQRPWLFTGEVRETLSIVYYWYRDWI